MRIAASSLAFLLACGDAPGEPAAAPNAAEVHRALLEQFAYAGPALFLVLPTTAEGLGTVRALGDATIDRLRGSGMDIDRSLADRLADAVGGPALSVEVPPGTDRLRRWAGGTIDVGPRGFFYAVEGRQAAVVELYPVAFSDDGARALTFLDVSCGPLECAAGFVVMLRRRGVEWHLEAQLGLWES